MKSNGMGKTLNHAETSKACNDQKVTAIFRPVIPLLWSLPCSLREVMELLCYFGLRLITIGKTIRVDQEE